MKRIAIYCVVYQSYQELNNYLKSIYKASALANDCNIDVFIADNTAENFQDIPTKDSPTLTFKVFPFHKNHGYFGGIRQLMLFAQPHDYDYVIISNVDVLLEEDFFLKLTAYECAADTGWIAPATISIETKYDLNPQSRTRYSLLKLRILLFLFKHPFLHNLYERTCWQARRQQQQEAGTVYAGHGSFIILTREYFNRCSIIDYPVFLYSEELYLGEMCHLHHLMVNYVPNIKVMDVGSVSTGKMQREFYYKCKADATEYIIHKFYV